MLDQEDHILMSLEDEGHFVNQLEEGDFVEVSGGLHGMAERRSSAPVCLLDLSKVRNYQQKMRKQSPIAENEDGECSSQEEMKEDHFGHAH